MADYKTRMVLNGSLWDKIFQPEKAFMEMSMKSGDVYFCFHEQHKPKQTYPDLAPRKVDK